MPDLRGRRGAIGCAGRGSIEDRRQMTYTEIFLEINRKLDEGGREINNAAKRRVCLRLLARLHFPGEELDKYEKFARDRFFAPDSEVAATLDALAKDMDMGTVPTPRQRLMFAALSRSTGLTSTLADYLILWAKELGIPPDEVGADFAKEME